MQAVLPFSRIAAMIWSASSMLVAMGFSIRIFLPDLAAATADSR